MVVEIVQVCVGAGLYYPRDEKTSRGGEVDRRVRLPLPTSWFPERAGVATLRIRLAGTSSGQFPRCLSP